MDERREEISTKKRGKGGMKIDAPAYSGGGKRVMEGVWESGESNEGKKMHKRLARHRGMSYILSVEMSTLT